MSNRVRPSARRTTRRGSRVPTRGAAAAPRRLGRYVAAGLLLLAFVGGVAAGIAAPHVAGEQEVGIEVTASPGGETTIAMDARAGGLSPSCGCAVPDVAAHDWFGFVLPSTGFDVDLTSGSGTGRQEDPRWLLVSVAPFMDAVDWLGAPPARTSEFVAVADGRELFRGRGTYLNVLGRTSIHVTHGERYPAASLIPGHGGETTIATAPPARPGEGGTADLEVANPARTEYAWQGDGETDGPDERFRGPAIDLIGPTVEFSFVAGEDTRMSVGKRALPDVAPGTEVRVTQRVAWSTRVMVQPASEQFAGDLAGEWTTEGFVTEGPPEDASRLPSTSTGRFVDTGPLPPFAVTLSRLTAPSTQAWADFARRSARSGTDQVPPMLDANRWDEEYGGTEVLYGGYGLPPVNEPASVVAYGAITRLRTTAHAGSVVVGTTQTPVGPGAELSVSAPDGLTASTFTAEPVAALGGSSEELRLRGEADVEVAGEQLTHPWWARAADNFLGAWVTGSLAVLWASAVGLRQLLRRVAGHPDEAAGG